MSRVDYDYHVEEDSDVEINDADFRLGLNFISGTTRLQSFQTSPQIQTN